MIQIPQNYYFTVHTTLRCNYNCSYCIQKVDGESYTNRKYLNSFQELTTKEWIDGLLNFKAPFLVISGGEVNYWRIDAAEIAVNVADNYGFVDIGTNLEKDPTPLIKTIKNSGKKNIKISSSFHQEFTNTKLFLLNIRKILNSGITQGEIAIVDTFDGKGKQAYEKLINMNVPNVALVPFQGFHEGILYPREFEDLGNRKSKRKCICKTTIIAISPNGNIFPCSHLTYIDSNSNLGNIKKLDENRITKFFSNGIFCQECGYCNPCSIYRVFPEIIK